MYYKGVAFLNNNNNTNNKMANIISNVEDFTKKTGNFFYNIANYDYLGLMMNTGYKDIPYVAYGMTGVVLSVFAYVTIKDDGIGETKSNSIIGDESMVGLSVLAPPAIFESQPEPEAPEPPEPPEPEEEEEDLVGGASRLPKVSVGERANSGTLVKEFGKKRKLSKKKGGQTKMTKRRIRKTKKKNHKK